MFSKNKNTKVLTAKKLKKQSQKREVSPINNKGEKEKEEIKKRTVQKSCKS